MKDNGFSYFLAFFYAQVVGLPAETVGLAIMLALVIDAFIDPIVGQLSDNTRSRWGRRHPWMYAARHPGGGLLPPALEPADGLGAKPALVAYLVAVAVLIRSFISCYEIPSAALAAELTTEYDERTRLLELSLPVRLDRRTGDVWSGAVRFPEAHGGISGRPAQPRRLRQLRDVRRRR